MRLPTIIVDSRVEHYQIFTAPNPVMSATIRTNSDEQVGNARYAVSPLSDRVYVFGLQVEDEHRRRGFGTALLFHLAKEFGQPITPVQELHSASSFWDAARQLASVGVVVTTSISSGNMGDEASRWQHVNPDYLPQSQ